MVAILHNGQRQARIDALTVYKYGTGAALAVVAAFFGAGELQIFAEQIEQRSARIYLQYVLLIVNRQRARKLRWRFFPGGLPDFPVSRNNCGWRRPQRPRPQTRAG